MLKNCLKLFLAYAHITQSIINDNENANKVLLNAKIPAAVNNLNEIISVEWRKLICQFYPQFNYYERLNGENIRQQSRVESNVNFIRQKRIGMTKKNLI